MFSYPEYSSNLQEDIYSETSGHFRDTLMNLVQVWYSKDHTNVHYYKNRHVSFSKNGTENSIVFQLDCKFCMITFTEYHLNLSHYNRNMGIETNKYEQYTISVNLPSSSFEVDSYVKSKPEGMVYFNLCLMWLKTSSCISHIFCMI